MPQLRFLSGVVMTPAERKFKEEACSQVAVGTHPTPTTMNAALRGRRDNELHGKQVSWLRAVVGRKRTPWAHEDWSSGYPLCVAQCCVASGYLPLVVDENTRLEFTLLPEPKSSSDTGPLLRWALLLVLAAAAAAVAFAGGFAVGYLL